MFENENIVLTQNPLANVAKKHVSLIFSPAGKFPDCFQAVRQSYLFRFLLHARMGVMDVTNMISHAMDKMNAISHATHEPNVILHAILHHVAIL
jgi:hypothetical protein